MEELAAQFRLLRERLDQLALENKITSFQKYAILRMSRKVIEHLASNYTNIQKEVGETMGGNILSYPEKDILEEGKEEGRKEGKDEGQISQLVSVMVKKIKKGKHLPQIADELELTEEEARPCYEAIISQSPEYNEDVIVSALLNAGFRLS